MKLLIVTDAWYPQVNGVVRTLTQMRDGLKSRGWEVRVLGPTGTTFGCPTYPEIRLTLRPNKAIRELLTHFQPEAIHIATEGPLGWAMRARCRKEGWPFTTSFHTRFPEYLQARFGLPTVLTYAYLRAFHRRSTKVLAPTPSIVNDLRQRDFHGVESWGRGVDVISFSPDKRKPLPFTGPIQLYVGRLAVEKNIEAFLKLDLPGSKVVVGDGPDRARLQKDYPQAVFMGMLKGEALAEVYASADVFVFPSRTDTFGLVMLEALASGLPVAAFPTVGPIDVITDPRVGVLDENLKVAIEKALTLKRSACREFALEMSWARSVSRFAGSLARFERPKSRPVAKPGITKAAFPPTPRLASD